MSDTTPAPDSVTSVARRVVRLSLKELRETLRDRRTILTLLIMPLLVYPLLAVVFQRFLLASITTQSSRIVYEVGVGSIQDGVDVERMLRVAEVLSREQNGMVDPNRAQSAEAIRQQSAGEQTEEAQEPRMLVYAPDELAGESFDLARAVSEGEVDVGIRIRRYDPSRTSRASGPAVDFEILQRENSSVSAAAREQIERRLLIVNQHYLRQRLRDADADASNTVRMSFQSVRSGLVEGVSLVAAIPLILTLMTVTGAVYPAIDLTAGERERGTLEALIAAPVPRLGLLIAKYVAVLTVALLTATVNLVAMVTTMMSIQLGPMLFGDKGLSLSVMAMVFGLTALFAAFFSAVLLTLTAFARSFKEAQAYLIPVMLLALAPGLLTLLPGLKMTPFLAITPLMNCVLLGRDLLAGKADLDTAAAVVITTMLYAILALAIAARVFGSDAVLYASRGTWADLFRRPRVSAPVATPAVALMCLGLIFPASILLRNAVGGLQGLTLDLRMLASSGLSVLLFVGIPSAAAVFQRVGFRTGFNLRRASPVSFLAGAMLGLSLWPFVYELVLNLTTVDVERLQGLVGDIQELPLAGKLLALALVPAATEEFFFRGYVLSSLRPVMPNWKAIVVSGLLFGLFHVVVRDMLLVERMIPSSIMGFVMAWVCIRTNSILPGTLLHFLHNGVFMTLMHYRHELEDTVLGQHDSTHLPIWLTGGMLLIVVPAVLILVKTRPGDE